MRPRLGRLTGFERFLSLFTSVRPGEGTSVLFLFATAFVLMACYYILKPVRDALILAEGSAEIKAYSQGIVAVTLVFILPLYKQLYEGLSDHESRSRVLHWVTAFFISNLVIFYLLGHGGIPISVPFYVWLSIFNVTVVAQFWAFAADLYNTRSGQRLFVVIMVGSSIGAWVGSQASKYLFSMIGGYGLMLLAAGILVLPIFLSVLAERAVPEGSENMSREQIGDGRLTLADLVGGFDIVLKSRYLTIIAVLILVITMVNTAGEYIVSHFVDARAEALAAAPGATLTEVEYLGRFWGDYYAWITLFSMLLQLFVVSRIFRWVGIRGAVLVLPMFIIIHYGILWVLPVFGAVRILQIAENAISYSLQNTTNHSLYLPLEREEKYVGKTTIDTFFFRAGDAAIAALVFVLIDRLGLGIEAFIALGFFLGIVALFAAFEIRRLHKQAIKRNLSNLPPKITAPLPDVYVPAGQLLMFSVPEGCFMDPDPGDTLEYQAQQIDGSPLPKWVKFDRHNQTFEVRPPGQSEGSVTVQVIASDFEGLTVECSFEIEHGVEGHPEFRPTSEDPAGA
ncbi:MAG: Npt1/Npt2 family nucleotide transporter [Xanthomonadales bacterium]|nr:Npt1/Npt2 family nucleotide transporter [Xanthomonadales bacterium]